MSSPVPLLITDSSCDLPRDALKASGIEVVNLHFTIDGRDYTDDGWQSISQDEFYARLASGAVPTTTAVPLADYVQVFTRAAESGRPTMYLGVAAVLSSSEDAAGRAGDAVRSTFPGFDLRIPDTLCVSAALGFLVHAAAARVAAGDGIDELEAWVLSARHRVHGYFTLDTMKYLARGGRIPGVVATAGDVLDLRPIIRLDARGRLAIAGQAHGRRKSIKALADRAERLAVDPAHKAAFIAHGAAPDAAAALEQMLNERVGFGEIAVCELGPAMAAHAGAGMLGLCFEGPPR